MEKRLEELEGKELFAFLKANKSALTATKKMTIKMADAFSYNRSPLYIDKDGSLKAAPVHKDAQENVIDRACVINTCWVFDSHKDVHIPGIWKKSLQENKDLYLLQEHAMTFAGIITDKVQAMAKTLTWKELGVDISGETQALVFNVEINKGRNPFMFDQYKDNNVKNHSVGMRYVSLELAINDDDYKEELAVWNKYINQIMNKDDAEESGYFWAVKEAKVIEGSAVPIGSNRITPTMQSTKAEDEANTEKGEPVQTTRLVQPLTAEEMAIAIKGIKFF